MPDRIVIKKKVPFCPGCGHTVVTNALAEALQRLNVDPLDVVVVSDIGCCGMVDGVLAYHTVHGLHGRSTALALGIALGLDTPDKKVIAIQGDGGATIGLQHLLEAARQNVDMTLIVHNNMVYGMTGGQISGLTSQAFKAERMPESRAIPPFDVCALAHHAGAALSTRAFIGDKVADLLEEAVRVPGFALVEIVEMCPAHGVDKVRDLHAMTAHEAATFTNARPTLRIRPRPTASFFDTLPRITQRFEATLQRPLAVVIAGSAGEGVQGAGDVLAYAGAASGLQTTKKGAFPVTVGSGFSVAEVILSRNPIHYTGIESPDVMIVVSEDGLGAAKHRIGPGTALLMDASLTPPPGKEAVLADFRKTAGKKGAALAAVAYWLGTHDVMPLAGLEAAATHHKHADKLLATIESAGRLVNGVLQHP